MAAPFSGKDSDPFGLEYGVETEYHPPAPVQDDIVPAVPGRAPAAGGAAPSIPPLVQTAPHQAVTVVPPPKMDTPPPAPAPLLHFTETTTSQHATGTISSLHPPLVGTVGASPALPASTSPGFSGDFSNDNDGQQPDNKKYAFYNPRYYRKLFDVDTKDVLWRVSNSMLGPFKSNFIDTTSDNPDLYGPFWVATTLVFVTAVAGWWGKLDKDGQSTDKTKGADYVANQAKEISISAAIFYGYILVVGLALYALARWFKGDLKLVTVWCIYGYALSIFAPVILLSILPFELLRWVLIMLPALSSALFLVRNFQATISAVAPARAFIVLVIMFLLHIALGLTIKLYFFPAK